MVVSTLTECFSGKSALAEFTHGECNPFPTGGQCPRDSTDDYRLLSVESLCSPSYHPCCQRLARIFSSLRETVQHVPLPINPVGPEFMAPPAPETARPLTASAGENKRKKFGG